MCGCGGAAAGQIMAAMPSAQPAPGDPILYMAQANSGALQSDFRTLEEATVWVASQGGGTVSAQGIVVRPKTFAA